MKTIPTLFLAGCFTIAALHAQNPETEKLLQDQKAREEATKEYASQEISRVECNASEGTLVLIIGQERLTYIPLADPKNPVPNVLPPLSNNRHERVMECLALQQAIREGKGIVRIMRWKGNKEVILSLAVIDVKS